jgi:hypothetical protein
MGSINKNAGRSNRRGKEIKVGGVKEHVEEFNLKLIRKEIEHASNPASTPRNRRPEVS